MTRILVIEDEVNILENIVETLELEGFEVRGTNSGREGAETAISYRPDLILCDIMMPDFNGYDVLMTLRNEPATSTTPFIFLTALAARSAMRHGMELGADDFLTKPFTPTELLGAINTRLEKHREITARHEAQMEQLRGNIIYALPHELRTPLTGLVGCAELLLMDYDDMDRESIGNLAEVMSRSATRLQRVVENYLLYAQIEVAGSQPERLQAMRDERVDYPGDLVVSAASERAMIAEREADLQIEADSAVVHISHENLEKIAAELADNAFKFSTPDSPVTVKSYVDGDGYYKLCVTDEGRGMSAEEINSIGAYTQFNRAFYEQQGLGLGLVIAKRLAELHGGDLTIDSTPDEGTTVCVRLPVD